MYSRLLLRFELLVFALVISMVFSGSSLVVSGQNAQLRLYTRASEFDYFDWTLEALGVKISQASLSTPFYFDENDQYDIVLGYINLIEEITQQEEQLKLIFSDPDVKDPIAVSQDKRDQLNLLYNSQNHLAPFAEAILEHQVKSVLFSQGLTLYGLPIPPVKFHITPLPYNIVISPRDKIQQSESISLVSDLTVLDQVELEKKIDMEMNVSSLVVPVGGIGSYPTMVERSTSLDWISNTIAHEWTHNWLSFKPLGVRYGLNNDIRTMNETTASIVGDEIGMKLIRRFYPEQSMEEEGIRSIQFLTGRPDPNDLPIIQFDFRSEMHKTRIEVDRLLSEGKIDLAESYMESRRQIFWDNGYAIRKLNQAYFAFYGAYANEPGGAAGEDPVGPAVRTLRAQSPTLQIFLEKISEMTSFEELVKAISN